MRSSFKRISLNRAAFGSWWYCSTNGANMIKRCQSVGANACACGELAHVSHQARVFAEYVV
ncbi:hypothetical protein [Nonomuraea rubra]|uniref:hypothetical protein n=1 Tax=Nonomuraea rubra TaxID=46180 RepID=UPI0033F28C7D